jgi:hypothetical protein
MNNENPGVDDLLGGGSSPSDNQNPTNNDNKGGDGKAAPTTTITLSDGRVLTPDQVAKEYESLHGDYTRKSQELAEIKKSQNNAPAGESEDIDPKAAALKAEIQRLGFTTKEDVNKTVSEKGSEIEQSSAKRSVATVRLEEALGDLETDFDGTEDKPKVARQDILNWIVKNPGANLSPLEIARIVYYDQFVKHDAKQLVGAGNGTPNVPQTESQGSGAGANPPQKPIYRFKDGSAERAAREMLGLPNSTPGQ